MPVGWYHSHTRSEVFFSDADIAIHKKFFPEPWQVALVLKPHTFEPMRGGFFFREAGGVIHGESSYREFIVEPQPMQALAAAAPEPPQALPAGHAPIPIPVPELESEPVDVPVEAEPPGFLAVERPARRRWPWVLAALAAAGIGAVGYQMRAIWLAPLDSAAMQSGAPKDAAQPAAVPKPVAAPIPLGLTTTDEGGQLHIAWDRDSPAVRGATAALLSISEGTSPLIIPLDQAHLQNGTFTYGRQGNRVDVSLAVQLADGRYVTEVATYVGLLPAKDAPAGDPGKQKQGEDLAKEAARLKTDLRKQAERTKKLESDMDQMRLELLRQQRTRMENMSPDAPKLPAKKK